MLLKQYPDFNEINVEKSFMSIEYKNKKVYKTEHARGILTHSGAGHLLQNMYMLCGHNRSNDEMSDEYMKKIGF